MLHHIFPSQFKNEFNQNALVKPDDFIFCFSGNRLLIRNVNSKYELPKYVEIKQYLKDSRLVYGFLIDGTNCFLYLNEVDEAGPSFIFEEVYPLRFSDQKDIAWISAVALQLKFWYNENQFCGKCGYPTEINTKERAISCKNCQQTVYPKISPAIIVAVLCGDKILLGRGVNFRSRFYSLIAGYADIGESLEDAVKREVKEEVGIDVFNIRYYSSQPWPYSGSMMIGYIAEADENQSIKIDEREISEAAWFTKDNLPEYPKEISIAGEMIEKFKLGNL